MTLDVLGRKVERRGLREKLTGEARYSADLKLPGMLYGAVLRSPHPHANVLSIDTSAAAGQPGVHAVVTPFDAPAGRIDGDLPILDTRVRYEGDEVAAVAADTPERAVEALRMLDVEYEILPFVLDADAAMQLGAPEIHPGGNLVGGQPISLERGNVEQGFGEADMVLEEEYLVPPHGPAALEPRAALANWEDGKLTVWKSTRGVHPDRAALARSLQMLESDITVIGPYLGAGFGSKDESRTASLAAVLSQRAGRPVRIEFGRREEFVSGRTRHGARIRTKVGVKADGTITAVHTTAYVDCGAYAASGPGVTRRLGQGSLYLYRCPNARYDGHLVYTNRPVGGSYRALGAPQGHFALESTMDRVAETLGIDPLEFRLKNRVPPEGQPGTRTTPADAIVDTQPVEGGIPFSSNGLEQCLLEGASAFGWGAPKQDLPDATRKIGRGMAMLIYRGGPGNLSSAEVRLDRNGQISLLVGTMDVGEGAETVLAQLAAETLGVGYDDVNVVSADTSLTPTAPITAGSTATFSTGTAVVQAAGELREKLLELATVGLEVTADQLEARGGHIYVQGSPERRMSLTEVARHIPGDELTAYAEIVPGSTDYIVNAFGAHFVEVEVDTLTGKVYIRRYVAAHDSGRILSPTAALNQVEGGISQMLGYTLSEELITDGPTGITLNGSFLEHKCPSILDYNDIQVIFADIVDPVGPMGAKSLGEPPCAAVAPAVANAIYDAIGVRFKALPITPDAILHALAAPVGGSA